jgi:NAD(P)-dependent dehydrogenase (short-subunit alcohol dehydrogenase family)
MSDSLAGHVYAIIAHGDETDRAIAVALAEAGASIAIATLDGSQDQEFAVASIANEVWAIGRDQFSFPLDSSKATHVEAFANEVVVRLGRCDGLIVGFGGSFGIVHSFRTAIPAVTAVWLSLEDGAEGALGLRDSAKETADAVIARLQAS